MTPCPMCGSRLRSHWKSQCWLCRAMAPKPPRPIVVSPEVYERLVRALDGGDDA